MEKTDNYNSIHNVSLPLCGLRNNLVFSVVGRWSLHILMTAVIYMTCLYVSIRWCKWRRRIAAWCWMPSIWKMWECVWHIEWSNSSSYMSASFDHIEHLHPRYVSPTQIQLQLIYPDNVLCRQASLSEFYIVCKIGVYFELVVKGQMYDCAVSSPLDRSKRFTLHPWQPCSFRHQIDFSGTNSSQPAITREDYSLTCPLHIVTY